MGFDYTKLEALQYAERLRGRLSGMVELYEELTRDF